jgi:hypothetical protein
MWRLQLPDGRSLPLRSLPATLGRDDAATLRVRHASIAPLHARLRAAPDGRLVVEAVGEAVVQAGGHAVKVATLQDGDELVLGQLSFVVRGEAPAAPPEPDESALLVPRARAAVPAAAPAARPAGAPPAGPGLPRRERRGPPPVRPAARGGLLQTDLSQLSLGTRALLLLVLLALAAGLAFGISSAFSALR